MKSEIPNKREYVFTYVNIVLALWFHLSDAEVAFVLIAATQYHLQQHSHHQTLL